MLLLGHGLPRVGWILSLKGFGLSLLGCEGVGVIITRAWRKRVAEMWQGMRKILCLQDLVDIKRNLFRFIECHNVNE